MPPSPAPRSFAPPPTMPDIAAQSRWRWPMPAARSSRHDLAGNTAFIRGATKAGRRQPAPVANSASHRSAGGRRRGVGSRGAHQRYSALRAAGTGRGIFHPDRGLAHPVAIPADDPVDHARRFRRCRDRRHRTGAVVQSVKMAGIFAAALRHHPAGDAGDRDRAAAPDLPAPADRGDRLRLDRGVLSGAVQHHARAEFGGSQSGRAVPALWRLAGADPALSQAAGRVALHAWRVAHRRRPVADRRGGRRNRRGFGRGGVRARLPDCGIQLSPQHSPNVRGAAVALRRGDCHLYAAGTGLASRLAALARKCAWKGKLMAAAISSEKIDLLVYGPPKPIVDNGFSDQFVLHKFETRGDLDRLTPAVAEKVRGMAVTYNTVRGDKATLAQFPKLEIIASFGVGYDHIDAAYAAEHNIMVTNTPDVLTEEVADITLGLLIATLREFVKADRYLRSGLWTTQQYPLSVGSLRDRKIGMVGMGRIGQAIGRRLEACRVPIVYHTRKPAEGVSYQHYPDLIEMAKAVDTLVLIVPGGPSTANMINAEVMKALGPRGVIINVARGSVVDEPALIAALKNGTILSAGLDVFANEPNVPDELKAMQNVVLLPHIGSASMVTRNAMDQLVVDNLKAWFAGKPPLTPVPETPAKDR